MAPLARDILDFWFGPPPPAARGEWFRKDAVFDAAIRARFGVAIESAMGGAFREWQSDAGGALARVLLLDQFTRNAFRDTPRAFAGDGEALATAIAIVDAGFDRTFNRYQRSFAYLPFEHAEDLAAQRRSVALFGGLAGDADSPGAIDYAHRHYGVISRFGRFPHRNAILGRESTSEELVFLSQPGSSF